MERKYLSGNIRERLQDLMKERKITQSELAAKIGMDVSTLSRFISNATGKLGDENAKSFVLCSFQPTKSACSASAEKCLSGVGQPLSSVSGRQRYNTLDFASKIVCQ